MKDGFESWRYGYDEYYDCTIGPEYHLLQYSTTNQNRYQEYKSARKSVHNARHGRYTRTKDCVRTVQRHIWKDYGEPAADVRHTLKYPGSVYQAQRSHRAGRVTVDTKKTHLCYTQQRGLVQVTNRMWLKFVAMNLKKLAIWKQKAHFSCLISSLFLIMYVAPSCLLVRSRRRQAEIM